MSDTQKDWALIKVRGILSRITGNEVAHDVVPDFSDLEDKVINEFMREFAHYIEAHEPAPVDRKLKCAREAARICYVESGQGELAISVATGLRDDGREVVAIVKGITLYEEGYGNDPLS